MGADQDHQSSIVDRFETPPLSPMYSMESQKGGKLGSMQKSPGMETHWEETVKPKKYQHWSLDQESTESELVAIPETSDKSDSTVHGSTAQVFIVLLKLH